MVYIIGIIFIIIVLVSVGLILRKRVYDEVDRQEARKMAIMDRNVASELSRIKRLNLAGETLTKFESWKERWERIITKDSAEVKENLFRAEQLADRYRIPQAKKTIQQTDELLDESEREIEKILHELNELMDSEETSRKEVEQLLPTIKEVRKELIQNRYQYKKAEKRFEAELDQLDNHLKQYDAFVESGDYSKAMNLVEQMKNDFKRLQNEIEEYPYLYNACYKKLPTQLNELSVGISEMMKEGYQLEHLGYDKEIHNYQQRLADCVDDLIEGKRSEVKSTIQEVEERMDEIYELLEKEALDKNYVEAKIPNYEQFVREITAHFEETQREVADLKKMYYIDDHDMDYYLSLEKAITKRKDECEQIIAQLEGKSIPHSELRAQLEDGFKEIEEIQQKHAVFRKNIQSLRKDELEAKEKLANMRQQINDTTRKIQKSNIPGVPDYIWESIDEAVEKNDHVLTVLEKQPLDMVDVKESLSEASSAVERLVQQTELMLDQAYLTEQVIQYANRYRSKNPTLATQLAESERLFRSCEYELALERAAKAIEAIEPGALKRIEELQMVAK
ncbi:MAG TPA: septation ring formation regulator EzrA [Bacillota bacterium]